MNFSYWWYWFLKAPLKHKFSFLGCFFGFHDGVYGIHGVNGWHVDCYKCCKRLDEGIEFEVCPVCEGKGFYFDDVRNSNGNWNTKYTRCFDCDGKGF